MLFRSRVRERCLRSGKEPRFRIYEAFALGAGPRVVATTDFDDFPPEAVERPGLTYEFAGDEHGRLVFTDPARAPRLGDRIEFFPPHCDPTFNLYDRVYAMRRDRVEAVWLIAARGRSD